MRLKKIVVGIILAVTPIIAFAGFASAQTFRTGQTANVTNAETIDGSVWISGATVDVAGKINGDVYCAGQTVTISADVDGDVFCAGQTVTFSGKASGSVRLAGQSVSMSGDVTGNATAAGQNITLEGQGKVGRDLSAFGQNVVLNGTVGRDVVLGSSIATLGSTIGRNVVATTDNLTLTKGANVTGAIDYTSPHKLTIESGGQIGGKVTYTKSKPQDRQNGGFNLLGAVIWAAMLIASGVVFALVFPRELYRTTLESVSSFPKTLLAVSVGLVAGIVVPVAVILLMITVLGVPLGILLMLAWIVMVALSGAFAAFYVGRAIWHQQTNIPLVMLLGVVILAILLQVPFVNIVVWFLAVWYGTGTLILELRKHAVTPQYDIGQLKQRKKN